MNNNNFGSTSETDTDIEIVSDGILNEDSDNHDLNNNIRKETDTIIEDVNNIDVGEQFKTATAELLNWIVTKVQRKMKSMVQNAIDLHLKGEGKLSVNVNLM